MTTPLFTEAELTVSTIPSPSSGVPTHAEGTQEEPTPPQAEEGAPEAWSYDEQVELAQAVLDATTAQASPRYQPAVALRDVLLTRPSPGPCRDGGKVYVGKARKGTFQTRRNPCRKWNCSKPSCAPTKVMEPIRKTLRVWAGVQVYRIDFEPTDGDWKDTREARRLMEMYPGDFARIATATGYSVVYLPGYFPGAWPVVNPGEDIARAFLDAPTEKGVRRFTTPKREAKKTPTSPRDFFSGRLPSDFQLIEVEALAEQVVGHPVTVKRSKDWQEFTVTGVTTDEVMELKPAFAELAARARAEKARMDADLHKFDTMFALKDMPGCTATPKQYADEACVSADTARKRLDALHAATVVRKVPEGRTSRYTLLPHAGGDA